MTFKSSNSALMENATTQSLITIIRTGMEQGCIRPAHLFDAVDEALCRLAKSECCSPTLKKDVK